MSRGDHRRKLTLAEYGFRLPSAIDNRPLRFNDWDAMRPQSVFVSATPGSWEMEQTSGVLTDPVIRPPALPHPPVTVSPVEHPVDDVIPEQKAHSAQASTTQVTPPPNPPRQTHPAPHPP